MEGNNIILDKETILNNIKNMYNGNWGDMLDYYCNLTKPVMYGYFFSVCDAAAYMGYLEVLKYAYKNGCPWNGRACAYAARNGHLEVLYYLYENEAPYSVFRGIHPNCKEFFDIYGEDWKNGDFSMMHGLKPAKNK